MLRHLAKSSKNLMTRRSTSVVNALKQRRTMTTKAHSEPNVTRFYVVAVGATLFAYALTSSPSKKSEKEDKKEKEEDVLDADENAEINLVDGTATMTEKAVDLDDHNGETPEHRYVLTDPEGNAVFLLLKDKAVDQFDITLYQYQVCPFCCKARAFLDYHKIPYRIVEVNPMTKSEVSFSKDYRKVPITMVEGKEQVNDSSFIITTLSHIVRKDRPQTEDEKKWRKWVDGELVHVLPPNIYRTMREASEAFDYISTMNHFNTFQRYAAKYLGSTAMYGVSKRLKKRHNIEDEREALYTLARQWTKEALHGKTFHGGDKPDLADLATYGVLSSIEGLQSFKDMVQNTDIGPWYERVKREVGEPSNV